MMEEQNVYAEDFDQSKHMTCPKCGFEVLYLDVENETVSYLFKDGSIDENTTQLEHVDTEDISGIHCNSVHCDWNNINAKRYVSMLVQQETVAV